MQPRTITYTASTDRNSISSMFFYDTILQSQVKRYFEYKNTDDVLQDCCLLILEQADEEKLVNICHKNEFNYWLFSCLKKYKNSGYRNTYTNKMLDKHKTKIQSNNTITYDENLYEKQIEKEHTLHLENVIKKELQLIGKKKWYDLKIFYHYVRLFKKYQENNQKLSYKDFGKEMNIDKDSLFATIKRVKVRIKKRLQDEL